jgi:type I restriction enzyme S subunit
MAQPKLNQKALNSILIPSTQKGFREKVVNNLDSLKGNVNSLETIYQRKLKSPNLNNSNPRKSLHRST